MAGYGGTWGGVPWGGAEFDGTVFDLFCFDDCTEVPNIVSSPFTTLLGSGTQFQNFYPPGGDTCDLGILSGALSDGAFPTNTAVLQIVPAEGLPNKWTFEWTLLLDYIPPNFNDLVNNHLYVGAANSTGPVGGVFISNAGLAYAGDIQHTGPNNDLVLNGPVEQIPGTADLIRTDAYTTFRMSADGDTGVVYLYVTPTEDLPFIGHRLVAVLPALGVDGLVYPVTDRVVVSVKGTTARPTVVAFSQCCLSASSLIPNLPPIADAGADQALRVCSILRLDGTASFDPEGVPLEYRWRLLDGPQPSTFVLSSYDGITHPLPAPTGSTTKLHSAELAAQHAVDPVVVGDVLNIFGSVYDITALGSDINGFYVQLAAQFLPDSRSGVAFKVLRQRGISNPDRVRATFLPDVVGFYRFDLIVNDGVLLSEPSVVVANVVESVLPRGITPDLSFMWNYLSDFWNMVEGKERLEVFWSSLAQIAASELWTLWQLEYSKSLRDIQRTFIRRWLHYDLLLGEPLPELTTVRVIYSGVTSQLFPPGGLGGVLGDVTITASLFAEPETFSFLGAGTYSVTQAANELRNRLIELDPRFTVDIVTQRDDDAFIRVQAPFPFYVESSTSAVFTGGENSTLLVGTGARVGARSFRTGVCLQGLGLQENDLFLVDGVAYLVAAVVDDDNDNVPFQRLTVKSDIPITAGLNWTLSGYATSELLDFYHGLVAPGDYLYFEVSDSLGIVAQTSAEHRLVQVEVLGVPEGAPSAVAFDPTPLAHDPSRTDVTVRLAKVLRRSYVPVDVRILDVPTLVEHIQMRDDEATLRFNLDFFREEFRGAPCLRFMPAVWEDAAPPDRLWAEYTYLDNNELVEGHFGIPAEFTLDDLAQLPGNVDYLSAVQGLWFAYFGGPTMQNLRVGSQILLGLPFAEEKGKIEEIRTDFSPSQGRMLIRDATRQEIVRSYSFVQGLTLETNPATGKVYAVGDTVEQFAPLVRGVEIVDWVKDPAWIQGFVNQGALYEVEKFHRFLVRVDSRAFNLAALLFAKRFLLKIKPAHTHPLFVVRHVLRPTQIDFADERHYGVTLRLTDSFCMPFSSHSLDDARSGGGGYWNQSDNQQGTSLPTFPTPDVPIDWGLDRFALCPSDTVLMAVCTQFAGGTPTLDSVWALDTPINQRVQTDDTSDPFVVPNGATGLALTADGSMVVVLAGDVVRIQLVLTGGPGSDPDDYELVLAVDGVDQQVEAFTSNPTFTDVTFTLTEPVLATDVISVRIRHAGGSPRNPAWTSIEAYVDIESRLWTTDDTLPAAKYCGLRSIS